MSDGIPNDPFLDLPASLVDDLLARVQLVGGQILESVQTVRTGKAAFRDKLQSSGCIRRKTDLPSCPVPTTCGTDGSYAIEKLLSVDLVAGAAVAVEGLTPPRESATWDLPHHKPHFFPEPHHEDTTTAIRSLTLGEELCLACSAPHQVVFIDGSAPLPIAYLNQASVLKDTGLSCTRTFQDRFSDFVDAYIKILTSPRSDQQLISVPKYTAKREIGDLQGWPPEHNDRSLLSILLEPGEYTAPVKIDSDKNWHLPRSGDREEQLVEALKNVHVIYFKPQSWLPAMRLEMSRSVATNPHRLAIVLEALQYQCPSAGILEPYPLYMADRMVKSLARSMPAFRQAATQLVAMSYDGDIGEVFSALHGYRSEQGRK